MRRLVELPWWVVVPAILLLCLGTMAGARRLVLVLFGGEVDRASDVAATLTAAFGALFAFLSAFLITNEWTQHNTAETAIANESAAIARLAWASDAPDVDQSLVVKALESYVDTTVADDWAAMSKGQVDALPSNQPYRELQTVARGEATATGVPSPTATEMLNALDALAQGRRDRLVAADRVMPGAIYGVVVLSGIALIVNTVVVAASRSWKTGRIVGSVALIIAFDLALALVISGPFEGSYVASPQPLQRVGTQLQAEWFSRN
jgi:hypothetical protein